MSARKKRYPARLLGGWSDGYEFVITTAVPDFVRVPVSPGSSEYEQYPFAFVGADGALVFGLETMKGKVRCLDGRV